MWAFIVSLNYTKEAGLEITARDQPHCLFNSLSQLWQMILLCFPNLKVCVLAEVYHRKSCVSGFFFFVYLIVCSNRFEQKMKWIQAIFQFFFPYLYTKKSASQKNVKTSLKPFFYLWTAFKVDFY